MKRRTLSFIITLALCLNLCPVWVLALDEGISGGLCPHHPEHTDECGYVSEEPGAPCTFVCRVCPIEDLISELPASVSADNSEQVQTQIDEIYALCDGLTMDELQQVDLSPCVSLLEQMDGLEAEVQSDASGDSPDPDGIWVLDGPLSFDTTHKISTVYVIDTNGYTLTGPNSTVIEVTETGRLDLKGTVVSNAGAGLEVSGTLRITEQANIRGQTYALYIASGASVYLSTGTYFGKTAAIHTADDNFADLLAPGCAYFDESGSPILPENMVRVREVVIKQCTDHSKTYIHSEGSPTHAWTCAYCGTTEQEEKCTFDFDGNVTASCRELCGNSINITVDESQLNDLIYNGADQTANVTLTVELNHGTMLVKDKDYTVDYSARADVGEITVTVTGVTFNGTFVKTYAIKPDQPGIKWDTFTCDVDYDSEGRPVDSSKLPYITINIKAPSDEDLRSQLKYSYRENGSTDAFTDGLPTNAGTYEVKAYLPASQNYEAAETNPCLTLTIKKIDALLDAPAPALPVYDGDAHALVTAGKVQNGAVIEYAREQSGPYTADIPTGINAGDYTVWYRVTADTSNYNVGPETEVTGVKVLRKKITPTVTPSESSYVYDGSKHEPQITVKEGTTEIGKDQYDITWSGPSGQAAADLLRAVGTYTANIVGKATGNYEFTATAKVEITPADQNALAITGKPSHVYYGDTVTTLGTTGGTANGTVKWSITNGDTSAEIDPDTGKLTIQGIGSVTVTAERTVVNYGTVSADWTFDVEPKPVVAEVTIQPKAYDGSVSVASSDIEAIVKNSDLVNPADIVTISGLKGVYDDANAGTNKTVTLDSTQAAADNTNKYAVSYPAAAKGDITPRQIDVTVKLSDNDLKQEDNGTYYYDYDGSVRTPAVTVTADDNQAVLTANDYTVDYSNNKNVSTENAKAAVTVTEKAGGNYSFNEAKVYFIIKNTGAVLTSTPEAKDLTYNGELQDLVTVGAATGGTVVYSGTGAAGSYSETIPQGKEARSYTVYYMVKGDANHASTAPGLVHVTIKPKTVVSPIIKVTGSYTYDGAAKKPTAGTGVTVEDGGTTIPATEYTLSYRDNVNAGTATVIVSDNNGGNYTINGTAAFEIAKANPAVPTPPTGRENLPYNGTAQALVTAGSVSGGTLVYSLNQSGEYSPVIPTEKDVGSYTVWYKVKGDSNHNDSAEQSVSASIIPNDVTNPTIQVVPESVTFNGKRQEPVVTVLDDKGLLIDSGEYNVTYSGDLTAKGTYTVTITGSTNGNYTFDTTNGKNTAPFTILPADQTPLTITGTRERVYYGETIQLDTMGGSGTVTWDVGGSAIASINNGLLTITGVGPVTVTATSKAASYTDQTATWSFFAEKKPVTAVVTAESKIYDGDEETTVTAALQGSDLVAGDVVKITLEGSFGDPNAGTDKTVYVDSTAPKFSADSSGQGNYVITYPATATASIFKANIDPAKVTPPTLASDLEYTRLPLTLVVVPGSVAEGGVMEYSLDNITYSASLPTGTDAGNYDVWYRVKGDGNHNDTEGQMLGTVTITPQEVDAPVIEFTPSGASYDSQEHKPSVTVKDKNGREIPAEEYTVNYGTTDWIKAGDHTVTITGKTGGNYNIKGTPNKTFTILPAGQSPLTIVGQPGKIQYGDVFTLSAVGGSGTGTVIWETSDTDNVISINSQTGQVKILKSGGPVTITARKPAGGGYSETTATWTFSAEKKPVTPIVTAKDKVYDTKDTAELEITWKSGDLLDNDTLSLASVLDGRFDSADAGNNKKVTINVNGTLPDGGGKYDIKLPESTTASITPKAASVTGPTTLELTYSGSEQELISVVTATEGNPAYSRDGVYYTQVVPKETNAGKYTVWYKAQAADTNHKDSLAVRADITIKPKPLASPVIELLGSGLGQNTDGTYYYVYDGTEKRPDVVVKDGSTVISPSEYTVSYRDNVQVGTGATVIVSNAGGGNYDVSGSKTFTIKAGDVSLIDEPQPNNRIYDGFEQPLVTPGTAVNGRMVYSETELGTYGTSIPRKTDAGTYQVWYKIEGENGAGDTAPKSVTVTIQRKQVTPVLMLNNQLTYSTPYTGSPVTPAVTVIVDGQRLTQDFSVGYSNNQKVGTATVTVQSTGGNYQFYTAATFEITKGKATFWKEPTAETGLVYTGEPQELVDEGVPDKPDDGIVLYSLDGAPYTSTIPTATKTGSYMVLAKVQGNSEYEDSDVIRRLVEIDINEVQTPNVELSAVSFPYTGSVQKPTVIISDDGGNVIPASEYKVTYNGDTVNPGQYTLTITSRGINYRFDDIEREITILQAGQVSLTITGKQDAVFYGDTLYLGVTGGSGDGEVTWTASGPVTKVVDGQYKVIGAGSVTITVSKAASGNYEATSDTWSFYAKAKPVTAVVTAESKTYDGDKRTGVTAALQSSDLVAGDVIKITLEGSFGDSNAGTDKTVYVDSTAPKFSDDSSGQGNYVITYPATTTASITPATAKVKDEPVKAENLMYTGSPQNLLSDGGTAEGGNLAYSLNGADYSLNIPTRTDAGSYTVWYKVVAVDGNHVDSEPVKVETVTIAARKCTPNVLCRPGTIQYDGTEKTPTVVVMDDMGQVIPNTEYTEEFESGRIAVGTYGVTVTDKQGGNYEFNTPVTGTFRIVEASQNSLSIITDKSTVYYGETFRLSAMGGSGNGGIHWSTSNNAVADIDSNGVVTVKGTGSFTITAYREKDDSYSQSNEDTVSFYAKPKPVTPMVTAENRLYDGTTNAKLKATWKNGDLVNGDTISLDAVSTGMFDSAAVGTNKRVTFVVPNNLMGEVRNYYITWPDSTTASIDKADVELAPPPVGSTGLKYTGNLQALVTPGRTKDNIGTIVYSLEQNGEYSTAVPTATGAGTYFVWYKVADSANYTGIPAAFIKVEIGREEPTFTAYPTASNGTVGQSLKDITFSGGQASVDGKFAWKNDSVKPGEGTSDQDMVFTPDDTANYKTVEFKVAVTMNPASDSGSTSGSGGTDTGGTPSEGGTSSADTVSTPVQTTVQNGTASTVVSAVEGSKLVKEAAANQSQNIVIKPEITSDVTKAQVSIPASTVSQIKNETNAALTVSAPIADVTIPNEALDTLARAGGTVDIVTEQVDQGVALTLTAGGEKVESVPGGLTLTVPVENAAPGTVAMLVHDDGTRETIRKSVAKDGVVNIPLSGSATVEIVDNSKEFADVPSTSWAADAVAFASAHELFNGTSGTTFGPDQAMSRGMLTTVLYNLEGRPEQDLTMRDLAGGYSDVSSDAWYADGVAWASEKGIVSGYGDGQFSPDDSVTREQFAVILWRYAGSPKANNQVLSFADAEQASSFAQEALCWAVENGILNGYANGQLAPGGTATRAEAAQMLKNFMENT